MALNESNTFEVCTMEIESQDPSNRFSNNGKILKAAWMIGPSNATITNGKVTDDVEDTGEASGDEKKSDSNTDGQANKTSNGNQNDTSNGSETSAPSEGKESYHRTQSYSILEAFYNLHLVCEDDTATNTSADQKQSEVKDKEATDTGAKENDGEKPKEDTEKTEDEDEPDSFQLGDYYEFSIGIPDEGFTKWKVAIDARANIGAVINAIKAKQFKKAYTIASKGLKSDGLVPVSASTRVSKKSTVPPPFIGHCRYAFDSGTVDGTAEDSLTICLAVAPIDAKTNKPKEDTVIKAVYNVVGDITGGKIGEFAAWVGKQVRDKTSGNSHGYDRYGDDNDRDSEQFKADELSKYLHNAFKCVGDHTMYSNFLKIRDYIQKNISAKNLELQEISIGNGSNSVIFNASIKNSFKNQLVYY